MKDVVEDAKEKDMLKLYSTEEDIYAETVSAPSPNRIPSPQRARRSPMKPRSMS